MTTKHDKHSRFRRALNFLNLWHSSARCVSGRTRLQRFLSMFFNLLHIYHGRCYTLNYIYVIRILDSTQLDHILKMTYFSSIQLCEIQRTLCFVNGVCEFNVNTIQRNLPVHFSMTTESVISMWMIMRWMLIVSALYYALYNLSRSQTFKPSDVNGWGFEILPSLENLDTYFDSALLMMNSRIMLCPQTT